MCENEKILPVGLSANVMKHVLGKHKQFKDAKLGETFKVTFELTILDILEIKLSDTLVVDEIARVDIKNEDITQVVESCPKCGYELTPVAMQFDYGPRHYNVQQKCMKCGYSEYKCHKKPVSKAERESK